MIRRKRGAWRWVWGDRGIAIVEQHDDGLWHVVLDGKDVGAVASPELAEALVERIRANERADR
jgi:hypothetical protein